MDATHAGLQKSSLRDCVHANILHTRCMQRHSAFCHRFARSVQLLHEHECLSKRCRSGLGSLRAELRTLQKREQEVRQQLEAKEKQAADLQVCLASLCAFSISWRTLAVGAVHRHGCAQVHSFCFTTQPMHFAPALCVLPAARVLPNRPASYGTQAVNIAVWTQIQNS